MPSTQTRQCWHEDLLLWIRPGFALADYILFSFWAWYSLLLKYEILEKLVTFISTMLYIRGSQPFWLAGKNLNRKFVFCQNHLGLPSPIGVKPSRTTNKIASNFTIIYCNNKLKQSWIFGLLLFWRNALSVWMASSEVMWPINVMCIDKEQ